MRSLTYTDPKSGNVKWLISWMTIRICHKIPDTTAGGFMVICWHNHWGHIHGRANRPISQIPQFTCPICHNTPFRTENVNKSCPISHKAPFRIEMCTFLFWMMYCGIWDKCLVGPVRLVYNCTKHEGSLWKIVVPPMVTPMTRWIHTQTMLIMMARNGGE